MLIKFINWFIRPLGYVCVSKGYLEFTENNSKAFFQKQMEEEILHTTRLWFSPKNEVSAWEFVPPPKPEYKDNVVPFNKLV